MKAESKKIYADLRKAKYDMEDLMESTEMRLHEMAENLHHETQMRMALETELQKYMGGE